MKKSTTHNSVEWWHRCCLKKWVRCNYLQQEQQVVRVVRACWLGGILDRAGPDTPFIWLINHFLRGQCYNYYHYYYYYHYYHCVFELKCNWIAIPLSHGHLCNADNWLYPIALSNCTNSYYCFALSYFQIVYKPWLFFFVFFINNIYFNIRCKRHKVHLKNVRCLQWMLK